MHREESFQQIKKRRKIKEKNNFKKNVKIIIKETEMKGEIKVTLKKEMGKKPNSQEKFICTVEVN